MIDIAEPQFSTLTSSSRVVLAVIASMTNKGERITYESLADRSGIARETVRAGVELAERRGLLTVDRARLPFAYTFTEKALGSLSPVGQKTR